MLEEFRKFAMRGNVVDMAVGIIIGTAFIKIVSSLVKDVVMPPVGKLMGNVDFSGLFVNLGDVPYQTLVAAQKAGAPTINYGVFVNTVLDFLVVAVAVFMVIKGINAMKKKEDAVPEEPTTKECPECLSEILLAAKRCRYCGGNSYGSWNK